MAGCVLKSDRCREQGFSLIELSIVLIIIGLLTVPALQAYNVYIQNRNLTTTEANLNVIGAALAEYYTTNGRYPCPADPTLATGNPRHGVETGNPPGSGDCTVDNAGNLANVARVPAMDFNGNGVADDYSGDGIPDQLAIGSVPYETLQIALTDTIDANNSKITYVISEAMTINGAPDTAGGIQVFQNDSANPVGQPIITIPAGDADGLPDRGGFHLILIAHNENQMGAFTLDGALPNPCNADGDNIGDDENCDGDANFLASVRGDVQGANYFDDQISYRIWSYGSLWSPVAGTDDIFNNNPGNVGVGTAAPLAKLHVVGNVRTDRVLANNVCDNAGNCFAPELIGGDPAAGTGGFDCSTVGPGMVLNGLASNIATRCTSANVPTLANQNCPAGQFVVGINAAGNILCAVTP